MSWYTPYMDLLSPLCHFMWNFHLKMKYSQVYSKYRSKHNEMCSNYEGTGNTLVAGKHSCKEITNIFAQFNIKNKNTNLFIGQVRLYSEYTRLIKSNFREVCHVESSRLELFLSYIAVINTFSSSTLSSLTHCCTRTTCHCVNDESHWSQMYEDRFHKLERYPKGKNNIFVLFMFFFLLFLFLLISSALP